MPDLTVIEEAVAGYENAYEALMAGTDPGFRFIDALKALEDAPAWLRQLLAEVERLTAEASTFVPRYRALEEQATLARAELDAYTKHTKALTDEIVKLRADLATAIAALRAAGFADA